MNRCTMEIIVDDGVERREVHSVTQHEPVFNRGYAQPPVYNPTLRHDEIAVQTVGGETYVFKI